MPRSARKDPIDPRPGHRLIGAATVIFLVSACENPQPPTACGSIPQQTVAVGETGTVTACFTDPNEDMLSFAATSSDPGVATASAAGDVVTVAGVSPGNASVTVTATDPGGLEAQQAFTVTVVGVSDLLFTEVTPRSVTVSPGDTAQATFTARNDGSAASDMTTARLFQSVDSIITTGDTELGVLGTLPALDPGEEVSFNVGVIIPSTFPASVFYVGVCLDPGIRRIRYEQQLLAVRPGNGHLVERAGRTQRRSRRGEHGSRPVRCGFGRVDQGDLGPVQVNGVGARRGD